MISWFLLVLRGLSGLTRSRVSLAAENAILRQQLGVLQRGRSRPSLRPVDRMLWIWLCRHWSRWRQALVLIQPATVLNWHREGYRRHWRRRSALVHGFEMRTDPPSPELGSCHSVAVGHAETGHRIEDFGRELHLDSLALEGATPHTSTDDRLVSVHSILDHAALTVA
jgi:hypothetical protein